MEGPDMMLTILLIGLGTLFWVVLMAVGCYCLHLRLKRLRFHGRADLEEEETILPASQPKNHQQQQYYAMTSNGSSSSSSGIARKLKSISTIGFRSPLIRTRSVG